MFQVFQYQLLTYPCVIPDFGLEDPSVGALYLTALPALQFPPDPEI